MKLNEFKIDQDFMLGKKRWRCTDIGTRTICAIDVGPTEVVKHNKTTGEERVVLSNDQSWFNGPPYAVPEIVFDEYAQEACSLLEEAP